jgi:hypothetical protein
MKATVAQSSSSVWSLQAGMPVDLMPFFAIQKSSAGHRSVRVAVLLAAVIRERLPLPGHGERAARRRERHSRPGAGQAILTPVPAGTLCLRRFVYAGVSDSLSGQVQGTRSSTASNSALGCLILHRQTSHLPQGLAVDARTARGPSPAGPAADAAGQTGDPFRRAGWPAKLCSEDALG